MNTSCRACTTLNGQGPKTPPHARLQLVRRRRHHELLALFFQCRTCDAEFSYLPGQTDEQHGWRMFAVPSTMTPTAAAAARSMPLAAAA